MKLKLFFLLLFCIPLFSCTSNKEKRRIIVEEKINRLNQQKAEWIDLNQRILNDGYVNGHLGKFINPDALSGTLAAELKQKGIYRLTVYKYPSCQSIDYTTNWTSYPIGSLYLNWDSCDSVQTQKGYYKDNLNINFIEVWGAGDHWSIWTDSDFI